jgi:hypothetical protein
LAQADAAGTTSTILAHGTALATAFRASIEAEIEWLIALLDAVDGDPDLEPHSDDEPGGDEEPSLGWTRTLNQARADRRGLGVTPAEWLCGCDVEAEHDGREPETA